MSVNILDRSTLRRWLLASAVLAPLAGPTVAWADPAPPVEAAKPADVAIPGEIVVTATRKEEVLSKVPISVSAFDGAKLDKIGAKSFADVVRFTPGVSTTTDNTHEIAIRGVSSNAGASTTGIYIDDTPIQIRQIGLNPNNSQPIIFDLERVEVLRGPQGTLFGSGSEGGTVRFITPAPSLTKTTWSAHAEASATEHGSPSYEVGAIVGAPLVEDKLGVRLSGWYRRDGGYINHQDPYSGATTKDTDWQRSFALRGALAWAATETLTITPSIAYQQRINNNTDVSGYNVALSNPGSGVFVEDTPEPMTDHDQFVLAALKLDWRGSGVRLITNTSLFKRHEDVNGYEGTFYNLSYFQHSFDPAVKAAYGADPAGQNCSAPGATCTINPAFVGQSSPLLTATGISPTFISQFGPYHATNWITNTQDNLTQEVRLQSDQPNARLTWTLGLFYSRIRQTSDEQIIDPQLDAITQYLWGEGILGAWGAPLRANGADYENLGHSTEWQLAGFLDATYRFTDTVKANLGLRYARSHFDFTDITRGPQAFVADPPPKAGAQDESPFTPKFNLSWQITPADMVYATASKGYRVGGANAPLLAACGITNPPLVFNSDSLWNYEAGTKLKLFGNKLRLSAAVYDIEWKNIQQSVYVSACGQQFVGNLGSLRSQGFDFEAEFRPVRHVTLNIAAGYTRARYTRDSSIPEAGLIIAWAGDTVAGPPFTVASGAQIDFTFHDHDGFLRIDDEYAAHNSALLPSTDPHSVTNGTTTIGTISYDPNLVTDPATNQLSARVGLTTGKVDWALYVNNLTDSHPRLDYGHQDQSTALYTANTFRPRTWGLSINWKY